MFCMYVYSVSINNYGNNILCIIVLHIIFIVCILCIVVEVVIYNPCACLCDGVNAAVSSSQMS